MNKDPFDYIFTGGGCAALSLVYQMLQQPSLQSKKILLIDREEKKSNDRTWCFWESGNGPFEPVVEKIWKNAWFHGPDFSKLLNLDPYYYKMIRSESFYKFVKSEISKYPNVQVLRADVLSVDQNMENAQVKTSEGSFLGEFIFNSIVPPLEKLKGHFYLNQHFKGWVIRTDQPFFNPEKPTLMDFRIDQKGQCRFMYILPVSENEALVEFTVFSENLLRIEEYDIAIEQYLKEFIGLDHWEILHQEFGSIPMFSAPFETHIGTRIINIGTAGGQSKASTGYTFSRIQKHSHRLINNILETGSPLVRHSEKSRFAYYDKVLLHVLAKDLVPAPQIFQNLFKRNKPSSVFRFLDEDTHFLQEYRLLNTVPFFPFIGPGIKELIF